jgi:endoglucanase
MPQKMNKFSAAALSMAVFASSFLAAEPAPSPKSDLLPRISVRGNRFVDPSGEPVLFRGLSIADPDSLVERGQWNRQLFVAVRDMGADLVRLPVHPASWRRRGKDGYLALLDQAVGWCSELGMHVIIDWHSIGNLQSGLFQPSGGMDYETTKAETFDFWRTASIHFHSNTTVAFYELFNEPTHYGGTLGTMTWSEWRDLNEEMIAIIRSSDRETIPLVAGFDWAYDDTGFRYEPVRADGIGYVTHPYSNKRSEPWEPRWEEDFAFMAGKYPMIATEIGIGPNPGEVEVGDYRNRITRFLEDRGISWMAWVFDPSWTPRLLKSWDGYQLSGNGEFFKAAMHRPPANKPESGK